MTHTVKLTEYSHGAGCGCKISPAILDQILASKISFPADPNLLVGNQSKDDAAAIDIGGGQVILSTTDFFMPIADDPYDFGRIAATNAISDIYAMGGRPITAIAILGWPLDKLGPEIAGRVIDGGRQVCADAGISLAGGHSIDAPEPIFGLAVTGLVSKDHLKRNDTAAEGCRLLLTKPLGIGVLTTAEKQKKLKPEHKGLATSIMCGLNAVGEKLGRINGVAAMTDVTGFGLLGHLIELCDGSGLTADIREEDIPVIEPVDGYLAEGCVPGGTLRNFDSYGHKANALTKRQKMILCDPQTSGGLLIAVTLEAEQEVAEMLSLAGIDVNVIGHMTKRPDGPTVMVLSDD